MVHRRSLNSTQSAIRAIEVLTALIRSINSDISNAQMGHVPRGFTKREWIKELMLDRDMTATRLKMHQERLERIIIQKKRILMHMR